MPEIKSKYLAFKILIIFHFRRELTSYYYECLQCEYEKLFFESPQALSWESQKPREVLFFLVYAKSPSTFSCLQILFL